MISVIDRAASTHRDTHGANLLSLSSCLLCFQGHRLTPGVIYVGHLPLGLFEPQLKTYFEQFGTVLRLRLSRSKKVPERTLSEGGLCLLWLRLKMSSDETLV